MQKRKITIILLSLNHDEIQKFELFVSCNYFNKSKYLVDLLRNIVHAIEKGFVQNEKKFNDKSVIDKVLKEVNQPHVALNQYCTNLMKLFEDFIYQEGISYNNQIEYKKDLAIRKHLEFTKFLIDRSKSFDSLNKFVQNDLEKGDAYHQNLFKNYEFRNANYYYYRFLYSFKQSDFISSFNRTKGVELSNSLYLFTVYFILNSLKLICLSATRNSIFNEHLNFDLQKEVELLADSEPYKSIDTIKIWKATLDLLNNTNLETYTKLKELAFNCNILEFSKEELYSILTIIDNKCKFIFKGIKLYEELFEINEFIDHSNLLLVDGYISEMRIRNYIHFALNINQPDKASQILEKYKNLITSEFRTDVYHFLKAKIFFKQKKYNEATDLLIRFVKLFPNHAFKIDALYLSPILIAYEQNDDIINMYIDRFSSFLSYNTENLSENHKLVLINFKNKMSQILGYKNKISLSITEKEKFQSFIAEISQLNNSEIAEREWLLEKTDELIIKFKIKTI